MDKPTDRQTDRQTVCQSHERRFFWPQANVVERGTLLLKMCTAPHARKHAEGFAEGVSSRKVCRRFAEAPRKGGPVFAGKCPRSMGSPMEPKPTQAASKHYLS